MASSAALEPQVNIAGLTNASIGMATFSKGCLCPGDKRTGVAAWQQQVQCNHSAWVVANAPQPGAAGQTRTSKPQHNGNRNSDKKTTQNIQTTSTAQSSQNGENKLYQTLLSPLPTGITARRVPFPACSGPPSTLRCGAMLYKTDHHHRWQLRKPLLPLPPSKPANMPYTNPCLTMSTQHVGHSSKATTTRFKTSPHGKPQ